MLYYIIQINEKFTYYIFYPNNCFVHSREQYIKLQCFIEKVILLQNFIKKKKMYILVQCNAFS